MSDKYNRLQELIKNLKQQRDEIALKIHLGKKEIKDEWDDVNAELDHFSNNFKSLKDAAGESSEDVWEALKLVGEELKESYQRIRNSL